MDCWSNMASYLLLILLSLVFGCCLTQSASVVVADVKDGDGNVVEVKFTCPRKLSACEDQCKNKEDCGKGEWCCTGTCDKGVNKGATFKTCVKPRKTACPPKEKQSSKCKDTCITDANCTDGYMCCEGGCEKNKDISYKSCVEINVCYDHCENGGICTIDHTTDTPQCYCMPGYVGEKCQTDQDDCEKNDNPCVHGKCTDKVNDYQCCCDEGYSGKNCTDVDLCGKFSPGISASDSKQVPNLCLKREQNKCQNSPDSTIVCKMVPRFFLIQKDGLEVDITDGCLNNPETVDHEP